MTLTNFRRLAPHGAAAALIATALWAWWPVLAQMGQRWWSDPEYSHGYLVPFFAGGLLWMRRAMLEDIRPRPSAWALAFLALGVALRLGGTYFYYTWLDQLSLLPILAAICLAVGGIGALHWAWPGVAFLLFMIPLPARLETLLAQPLQRAATLASTNILQTLGFFAQSEGSVILLTEAELGVVEACSGLRMMMVFFAISTGLVVVIHRSMRQKIILIASAVPIALLCNILRITLTGILHETVGHKIADVVFHDLAGLLMIPLALAALAAVLKLLSHLFVLSSPHDVMALSAAMPLPNNHDALSRGSEVRVKESAGTKR
jgi:exosortase